MCVCVHGTCMCVQVHEPMWYSKCACGMYVYVSGGRGIHLRGSALHDPGSPVYLVKGTLCVAFDHRAIWREQRDRINTPRMNLELMYR